MGPRFFADVVKAWGRLVDDQSSFAVTEWKAWEFDFKVSARVADANLVAGDAAAVGSGTNVRAGDGRRRIHEFMKKLMSQFKVVFFSWLEKGQCLGLPLCDRSEECMASDFVEK